MAALVKQPIPHIITIYEPSAYFAKAGFSERHILASHVDLSSLNPDKHFLLFVGGDSVKALTEQPALNAYKWHYAKDEQALTEFYLGIANIVNRLRYQKPELKTALQNAYNWPEADFPNLGSWAETQHQMLAYYLRQTGNRLTTAQSSGRKYAHIVQPEVEDAGLNAWCQSQIQTIRELHRNAFKG